MGERAKYPRAKVSVAGGRHPGSFGLDWASLASPPHPPPTARARYFVLVFVTTAAPAANSACFVSGYHANVRAIQFRPSGERQSEARLDAQPQEATDVCLDPLHRCSGELRHCLIHRPKVNQSYFNA